MPSDLFVTPDLPYLARKDADKDSSDFHKSLRILGPRNAGLRFGYACCETVRLHALCKVSLWVLAASFWPSGSGVFRALCHGLGAHSSYSSYVRFGSIWLVLNYWHWFPPGPSCFLAGRLLIVAAIERTGARNSQPSTEQSTAQW